MCISLSNAGTKYYCIEHKVPLNKLPYMSIIKMTLMKNITLESLFSIIVIFFIYSGNTSLNENKIGLQSNLYEENRLCS